MRVPGRLRTNGFVRAPFEIVRHVVADLADMRCSIAFVTSALLFASAAVDGCARDERSPFSSNAGPSPLPSSVAASLVAQAPVIGATSFGPGVAVSIFRPPILFSEARVVDETLYVMYYPKDSSNQQIASVSRGILHPVVLAHQYFAMSFKNDNRLIYALGEGDAKDWYMLRDGRALPVARPASPVYGIPHHVLADGDSCADGLSGSDSALDDIQSHRRVSILSDAAMSRATNGALSKAVGVYCDHFHGKNYATMDTPGVIFRLDGDNASLISTGWIEASSERHLLIETDDAFVEAEVP